LNENVRYFLETAPSDCCFVVAGDNAGDQIDDPRVFYAGKLDWLSLVGLFKRSETFVHLAWLDHCPNVVVDARAAGCHIVCSSTGGTNEIAGRNSTIILEDEWDLEPVKLYEPPLLDFSRKNENDKDSTLSINQTAERYIEVFRGMV
jgi:glycosyltransferase involved in cell wall biosynthesis